MNHNKFDIDRWVNDFASSESSRFYPSAIALDTNIPVGMVLGRLLKLVNDGKIALIWEIKCANESCCSSISTSSDFPTIGSFVACGSCGDEVKITEANLYPLFEMDAAYKVSMNKKHHRKEGDAS